MCCCCNCLCRSSGAGGGGPWPPGLVAPYSETEKQLKRIADALEWQTYGGDPLAELGNGPFGGDTE